MSAGVHVALLRGVNVGGRNKLAMKPLAELFAAAGCADVRTWIQSGNVLFRAEPAVVRGLAERIAGELEARHGLRVPVVLRTAAELRAAERANPFLRRGEDEKALHLAFLADRPARKRAAALDPERSPGDELALRGRELYLFLPGGVARSKLTSAYLDATLGTTCTARNWRTVRKLVELAGAL